MNKEEAINQLRILQDSQIIGGEIASAIHFAIEDLGNNEKFRLKDYFIMDQANVIAIVPLNKENDNENEINLKDFGRFKKFEDPIDFTQVDLKTFNPEIFKLGKSRYSVELLNQARKTSKAFLGSSLPVFYKWFEDNEFKDDQPCLVKFEKLVFAIAPRIEGDD